VIFPLNALKRGERHTATDRHSDSPNSKDASRKSWMKSLSSKPPTVTPWAWDMNADAPAWENARWPVSCSSAACVRLRISACSLRLSGL
jgi:hypothetical protein